MDTSYLLAKFGKREHLEMLLEGNVYLNPISRYREDTTAFRGDRNEGKVPIDPLSVGLFDEFGNNIFDTIPRPTTVMKSMDGDDSILIFCASMITKNILYYNNEGYVFTDDYKSAIKEFGEYVLLFYSGELLKLLQEAQKHAEPEYGLIGGPIIYRDLNNFENDYGYLESYNITGSLYDPYFVKSNLYEYQNEWRLIVDGSYGSLPTNDNGAYTIKISKMEYAYLYETEVFLESFIYKDDKKL